MRDAIRERDLAHLARVPDCVIDVDDAGMAHVTVPRDGLDRILAEMYLPRSARNHYGAASTDWDGDR